MTKMAMNFSATGVWEKHFHRTSYDLLCRCLLLPLLTSIQLGNKWSMAHLERRGSSLGHLHCILLLLSVLFCPRHHPQRHLPLLPCAQLTENIIQGLSERLERQRLGPFGRSPLWVWQRPPVHGRASCRLCRSRCCSGWFENITDPLSKYHYDFTSN